MQADRIEVAGNGMELLSALFVDFDNIFIGFDNLHPEAGRRFATQPGRWIAWLERGEHARGENGGEPAVRRRILVRRCYLNPIQFGRFRSDFIRAAFNVVDCPPLTTRGKNSTDIYMALDIIDALEHPTRFDEFIILSSDADFTPVLLRLRTHNRRTAILCADIAAAAYKAACDHVVQWERFFESALGITEEIEQMSLPGTEAPRPDDAVLARAARLVFEEVLRRGPLAARDVPRVLADIPSFRGSNWFGLYSLKALAARLMELEPALATAGDLSASWSFVVRDRMPTPARAAAGGLAERVVAEVRARLARSPRPLPMAPVAGFVSGALGPEIRASDWAGYGSLAALLRAAGPPDVAIADVGAGYLYDPVRHEAPAPPVAAEPALAALDPDLQAFILRLRDLTGVPALGPAEYATLFGAIAEAAAHGSPAPSELSRAVRDLCQQRSGQIGRAQINFVLSGYRYHGFDVDGRSPQELAEGWIDNVLTLCGSAQLELSPTELAMLRRWIAGGEAASSGGGAGEAGTAGASDGHAGGSAAEAPEPAAPA
jgi:hypothetical protein